MSLRDLSAVASFAEGAGGAKLFAPSAEKNIGPIANVLAAFAPETGQALEMASGTGQHIAVLAQRIPQLHWQPTEPDAARRASIDAYAAELCNVAPAVNLDACAEGWGALHEGQALITLSNLLHLVSEKEARTLVREAGRALTPQGILHLYGPFLRDGETTSEGDAEFHAKLTAEDPTVGYKNDRDVIDWLRAEGLEPEQLIEMPANNLSFVAKRRA